MTELEPGAQAVAGWVAAGLVVVGVPRRRGARATAARARRPSGPRSSRSGWPARRATGESVYESRSHGVGEHPRPHPPARRRGRADRRPRSSASSRSPSRRRVLLVPKASGFDALVWVLPVAAFVCAARRARRDVPALEARGRRRRRPDRRRPRAGRRRAAQRLGGAAATSAIRERRSRDESRIELAELEDERRFLLRSLRDLDAEHAAGDVDDADYATLRDGYTKRAADVLRAIEEGGPRCRRSGPAAGRAPCSSPRSWSSSPSASAILVARIVRPARRRGRPITGGAPTADTATLLARARTMFGVDARGASDLYRQVLDADPTNLEALTYQAWLIY